MREFLKKLLGIFQKEKTVVKRKPKVNKDKTKKKKPRKGKV
tara:strand:+ start:609 stop:731 length:123 start_codon:yes stop_codon:yes gene_type:complete